MAFPGVALSEARAMPLVEAMRMLDAKAALMRLVNEGAQGEPGARSNLGLDSLRPFMN